MYTGQFSIEIHSKQKFAAEITILRTIWTGADLQFLRQADSPQVTLVMYPAAGCRYFLPGPQLSSQLQCLWLVANYAAWFTETRV